MKLVKWQFKICWPIEDSAGKFCTGKEWSLRGTLRSGDGRIWGLSRPKVQTVKGSRGIHLFLCNNNKIIGTVKQIYSSDSYNISNQEDKNREEKEPTSIKKVSPKERFKIQSCHYPGFYHSKDHPMTGWFPSSHPSQCARSYNSYRYISFKYDR